MNSCTGKFPRRRDRLPTPVFLGFPDGLDGKNPPTIWETWVQFLGWENPLEEGVATHFSILAWRILMDRGAWRTTVHGVQLQEGRRWSGSGQSRPLHAAPAPWAPGGCPTCSRCRTLLARRSNTTSVWSSLPEMMCRSSASSASTALECSRRLFSRAGPTLQVRGQGGGQHQSPLGGPPGPRISILRGFLWGPSSPSPHPTWRQGFLCPSYPHAAVTFVAPSTTQATWSGQPLVV